VDVADSYTQGQKILELELDCGSDLGEHVAQVFRTRDESRNSLAKEEDAN
jgi:hypothetical protein